jgi:hypothetical protein
MALRGSSLGRLETSRRPSWAARAAIKGCTGGAVVTAYANPSRQGAKAEVVKVDCQQDAVIALGQEGQIVIVEAKTPLPQRVASNRHQIGTEAWRQGQTICDRTARISSTLFRRKQSAISPSSGSGGVKGSGWKDVDAVAGVMARTRGGGHARPPRPRRWSRRDPRRMARRVTGRDGTGRDGTGRDVQPKRGPFSLFTPPAAWTQGILRKRAIGLLGEAADRAIVSSPALEIKPWQPIAGGRWWSDSRRNLSPNRDRSRGSVGKRATRWAGHWAPGGIAAQHAHRAGESGANGRLPGWRGAYGKRGYRVLDIRW